MSAEVGPEGPDYWSKASTAAFIDIISSQQLIMLGYRLNNFNQLLTLSKPHQVLTYHVSVSHIFEIDEIYIGERHLDLINLFHNYIKKLCTHTIRTRSLTRV